MSDSKELATPDYSQLDFKESTFVNEYTLDFNIGATCKRMRVDILTGKDILNRPHVQATVYAIISDKFKRNQALVEQTLENARLLSDSDIADFVDWGERPLFIDGEQIYDKEGAPVMHSTLCMKDKSEIKNTKAIKSIKMGKHGLEVVLHDKASATNLLFQTLGLLKKAQEATTPLVQLPPDADVAADGPPTLREALLQLEKERAAVSKQSDKRVTIFEATSEDMKDTKNACDPV